MTEWEFTTLGKLAIVKHGWPFKSEHLIEPGAGKPIVVAIGNFKYTGGFRFKETRIREYSGDFPQEYALAAGDILLIMTCQTEPCPMRYEPEGRPVFPSRNEPEAAI
jgi:type I restriction enzyme S subunit